MSDVIDNTELRRFELHVDGAIVFANYRTAPGTIIITHTETPPALRGRGLAAKLAEGVLAKIRADGLKIVPACSYFSDYLGKHPEYDDLQA